MDFVMPEYISLKDHASYDERWLQDKINENPSLLGLGDLNVRDRERRQPSAGRLDLLLTSPESDTRYVVEIQLGATDESHLIRTIEYWDIERRRFPKYEHIAVIVAEDITSRFLNVIGLLNRTILLIAIQLKAVQIKDTMTLVATQVVSLLPHEADEEDEAETVDRAFWERQTSQSALEICDQIVKMIGTLVADIQAKYTRHYVGLTGPSGVRNFVTLNPRKGGYVVANFKIPFDEDIDKAIDDSNLDKVPYEQRLKLFRARIRKTDLDENQEVIMKLIQNAHERTASGA